jgi:hypothetical protein
VNEPDQVSCGETVRPAGGCDSPCDRRFAAALLDQQMWCWGCDIRRPEGNVLLQFGFSPWRPPAGTLGSTAYQLHSPPSRQLVLWGFGLFYGDGAEGGLYLKRFTFSPLWCPNPDLRAALWRPEDLPEFRRPSPSAEQGSLRRLLAGVLHWTAAYETWVLATLGPDYRRQCLARWEKAVAEAETVPGHWLRLAEMSASLLTSEPVAAGL